MVQINHPFREVQKEDIQQSIPSRFEKIVDQQPDHLAIQTISGRLTYEELNHIANRVAHSILSYTDGRDVRAVLLLEEPATLIAAMLGALKAGCVCTSLETTLPLGRIESVLQDSQPEIVVTSSRNLDLARRLDSAQSRWINIDALDAGISDRNPQIRILPEALSFILYTSGTTGQPKGIMQMHRNGLRNAGANINAYQISHDDRIPFLSSSSTGHGIVTILLTLLGGAALFPYNIKERGVVGLIDLLTKEEITVISTSPTLYRHINRTLTGKEDFSHLRLIRLGGEPVMRSDFELYLRNFAEHSIFVNAISTTETGNFAQFHMDKNTEIQSNEVPIGYPVKFMEVLLINDCGEEVGTDTAGQIAIKSSYISPGYWEKPELTKEAFHSVAHSDQRIYFTGDLGRRHPDGCLEHLGRKDFQVRIRGFRVEPEEIESFLQNHPAIFAAAVHPSKEGDDDRLIAYFVQQKNYNSTAKELYEYLKRNLPDYMLPSQFVLVDSLPLTVNGKVDRGALSKLNGSAVPSGEDFVPPRNPLEENLAGIWSEILHQKPIGIYDNFFELGGHSLSATQLLARIQTQYGVEIPLGEFFKKPTIVDLVEFLCKAPQITVPPIQRVSRNEEWPLSFAQQRLWFLHKLEPASTQYSIVRAYRIHSALNVSALQQALSELVRRHELLRTSYPSRSGIPVQLIAETSDLKLHTIDLTHLPHPERESRSQQIVDQAARRPFDLEKETPFRSTLFRLEEHDHILLLSMHHIATDIWSKDIFTRELMMLYEAFLNDQPSPLSDLTVQYVDFAVWQKNWLQKEILENLTSYWSKKLDGLSELKLPTKRLQSESQCRPKKIRDLLLPDSFRNELQSFSEKEGVTLFMTLLAAFQSLLHLISEQCDIAVGIPIANRRRQEIESVIGFFVNTLVLRCDLSGDPSFRSLLSRVRQTTLEAYDHQDLPFDKLVEKLNPKRGLNRTPFFRTIFSFRNEPLPPFGLSGLTVKPISLPSDISLFDLSLSAFVEHQGLQILWEYNSDLFDDTTISTWASHYQSILQKILSDPSQRLSSLRPERGDSWLLSRWVKWRRRRSLL